MKNIVLAAVMMFAFHSYADWAEDAVIYDVTSKDAMEIAEALTNFPHTLDWLSAHNLTSPSRLKVVGLTGRVAWYRWENDSTCTVADPGAIARVQMYSSTADYLFEAAPATVWQLVTQAWKSDPCVGTPNPKVRYHKSKRPL